MTTLTERAAELLVAAHAFDPATPGFVGAALELPVAAAPSHRVPLRHGFLDGRSARVVVVSGPPSPGLPTAIERMTEDLAAMPTAGLAWPASAILRRPAAGPARLGADDEPAGAGSPACAGSGTGGVRVALEAGLDGG
ncbi:glutamylcysteine synthetase, partial [Actinoplanes sp. NPDC049596]